MQFENDVAAKAATTGYALSEDPYPKSVTFMDTNTKMDHTIAWHHWVRCEYQNAVLKIFFSALTVTIKGAGLKALRDYVGENRVSRCEAIMGNSHRFRTSGSVELIESITVEVAGKKE